MSSSTTTTTTTTPQTKGTILVTGGGGYIGGHIVRAALDAGFSVRITARTAPAASRALSRHPASYAPRLSSAVVSDMTDASSYAAAFADGSVVALVHAASPFVLAPRDNVRELLEPATRGAVAVLEAARRYAGPRLRSVVATSSFAAVIDVAKGNRPGYVYTERDWNPMTWEQAAGAPGVVAYVASKALAEKAMWAWMEAHGAGPKSKSEAESESGSKEGAAGVSFGLTTICPPWVFGPYAHDLTSRAGLSESLGLLDRIVDADAVPPFDFGGYADVREVAAAHVLALENPAAAAGRRFIVGQDFRYQAAVDAAREGVPELRARLPVGNPGEWLEAYHIDGSEVTRVLGLKYGTLKDTVVETYRQLLRAREAEEKEKEKEGKA